MTLVEKVGVEELTPARVIEDLLDALAENRFGSTDDEARAALDFAAELWISNSQELKAAKDRLGIIPVPTGCASKRAVSGWRPAREVYFGHRWTGDRTLEDLYGPFGEAEFLAETAPSKKEKARNRTAFFEALGVARAPRMVPIEGDRWQLPQLRWKVAWLQSEDVSAALVCPDDHSRSGRHLSDAVVDRLDALLDNPTRASSQALCVALLDLESPLGQKAQIHCTHPQHKGSKGQKLQKATGYQEFALRTREWVPVRKTGRLDRSWCRPEEAWTDVPAKLKWLDVPQTTLAVKGLAKFGLPSVEHPSQEACSAALLLLHDACQDLSEQPTAARTARWLQERLDTLLQRLSVKDAPQEPWFFGTLDGTPGWTERPLIPDVPGLTELQGVELLPAGRPWGGLRRAYGLQRASEVIKLTTKFEKTLRRAQIFPRAHRIQLLAFLISRGEDGGRVAPRLGRFVERHVSGLTVRLAYNGQVRTSRRDYFLEIARTRAGSVDGATLYVGEITDEDAAFARISQELARYLDVEAEDTAVELFFASRRTQVEKLSDEDVQIATDLLRKYTKGEEIELDIGAVPDAGDEREDEDGPDSGRPGGRHEEHRPGTTSGGQQGRGGASAAGGTSDRSPLTDADSVKFGSSGPSVEKPAVASSRGQGSGPPSAGAVVSQPLRSPNPETERQSVRIAIRYGTEELGAEVKDVQSENLGWDLEFMLSTGRRLLVEVKGAEGDAPFVITRNERRAAREHPSDYRLIFVANLRTSTPEVRLFDNIGEYLTEEIMDPTAWAVRHWQRIPHVVVRLTQDDDARDGLATDSGTAE